MHSYRVSHHAPSQLRRGLLLFNMRTNHATAMMLAYLGEFDEQKLYRPEAYSSMHQFCISELGMSQDAADKRIRVARITREFPALLPAIADGRLNLSGVLLFAPVLTQANADDIVHAASRLSCEQIRTMLAQRFPKPEPVAQVVLAVHASDALAAEPRSPASKRVEELSRTLDSLVMPVETPQRAVSFARFTPVAPGRYAIEGRVDQALVEKLQRAQQLLSHGGTAFELAQIFELAADLVLAHAERKRFGATSKPRGRRNSGDSRHIPEAVKREVFTRDGGSCTFTSSSGRRCEARDNIEFDHVRPVARGGRSVADNVRLLCRAHNQMLADQTFGPGFMRDKREGAHRRALEHEERAAARAAQKRANDSAEELVPGLMNMGYSQAEARSRARSAGLAPDLPIGQRMLAVLKTLGPRGIKREPVPEAAVTTRGA